MDHDIHEHHEKAAHHHDQAAKHHREAAKHHRSGHHEKAAHHSKVAHGHSLHATEHHEHASKKHAEHHSYSAGRASRSERRPLSKRRMAPSAATFHLSVTGTSPKIARRRSRLSGGHNLRES